jgi:hypothetical protein
MPVILRLELFPPTPENVLLYLHVLWKHKKRLVTTETPVLKTFVSWLTRQNPERLVANTTRDLPLFATPEISASNFLAFLPLAVKR